MPETPDIRPEAEPFGHPPAAPAEGRPFELASTLQQALELHQAGRLTEAEQLYGRILGAQPDHCDSLHLLGVLHHQRGDYAGAIRHIDAALRVNPAHAGAHSNRAVALQQLKRYEEALASCDRAIALKPDYAEAFNNRGNALKELGRLEKAVASYDCAIALKPDYADAFNNRGVALAELKRYDDALASCGRAIALRPGYVEAFNHRGNALKACRRFEDALGDYDRAIALKPDYADAFVNRGTALAELKRYEAAVESFDAAIALDPRNAEAYNNRGNALEAVKRLDEALASYDIAVALKPDYADAFHNRGNTLAGLQRLDKALASYQRAFVLMPDHKSAFSGVADCAIRLCDWRLQERLSGEVRRRAQDGNSIFSLLVLLNYCDDEALHLACAKRFTRSRIPDPPAPLWRNETQNNETGRNETRRNERIRIAYLSADFREHPVAQLTAELFERHDRSRFEVIGMSLGADDGSPMRARLVKAFDQFHDVSAIADRDAARMLHGLRTDIVVDLTGYTMGCRPEILAYRPAPIAVGYLGYPGTMGADFIDYMIADKIVLPIDRQSFYTEAIAYLPDCFQPNDSRRDIAAATPLRREAGLPDHGFVFCGFNNPNKLTAPVFDIWMRLLGSVDDSVLWLSRPNDATAVNLRAAAAARGIDPARLVFASRTSRLEDHLARHRLADLFLDTLPYNAHTTASDALWAGLPVLTCRGRSLAGRVAASLLHAVGLPELATENLTDYEALALRLATDPARLADFRARLARNRLTFPLFDADRFRRHIEAAYTTMWEIWQRGERPRGFSVAPEPRQEVV